MKNIEIGNHLRSQRNFYFQSLAEISELNPLFAELFNTLKVFDFEAYKAEQRREILLNLKEWWTNPERGIVPEEELYALVFEYDNYLFEEDLEALAYGINKWDDFAVHTEEFEMGYDYDFATESEASPGISVRYFNPLAKLDAHYSLEDLDEDEGVPPPGLQDLINAYTYSGLLAIHEVFLALYKEGKLNVINMRPNFTILMGEHDAEHIHPLLIIE